MMLKVFWNEGLLMDVCKLYIVFVLLLKMEFITERIVLDILMIISGIIVFYL